MKYILLSAITFCITLTSYSQDYNEILIKHFGERKILKMELSDPEKLAYLNFYSTESFSIGNGPGKKNATINKDIKLKSLEFNPFLEKHKPLANQSQYFNIVGTSKVLLIYSESSIRNRYERFKKTNK